MSDIEKAIKHFTKRNFWLKANPVCQRVQKRVDKQNYEIQRNDLAISALEKQIPKKPKEYEDKYYACKCGNVLLLKWLKYPTELMPKSGGLSFCLYCGQKLDWSAEE